MPDWTFQAHPQWRTSSSKRTAPKGFTTFSSSASNWGSSVQIPEFIRTVFHFISYILKCVSQWLKFFFSFNLSLNNDYVMAKPDCLPDRTGKKEYQLRRSVKNFLHHIGLWACLWGILLIGNWCRRNPSSVAIPGQVVMCCVIKLPEQTWENFTQWCLFEFLTWVSLNMNCNL